MAFLRAASATLLLLLGLLVPICLASTKTGVGSACNYFHKGTKHVGVCNDKTETPCPGFYKRGLCPGPAEVQCCVSTVQCTTKPTDTPASADGRCQDINAVACHTTRVAHLCPEGAEVMCCVGAHANVQDCSTPYIGTRLVRTSVKSAKDTNTLKIVENMAEQFKWERVNVAPTEEQRRESALVIAAVADAEARRAASASPPEVVALELFETAQHALREHRRRNEARDETPASAARGVLQPTAANDVIRSAESRQADANGINSGFVDFFVPGSSFTAFENIMKEHSMPYEVVDSDVSKDIQTEIARVMAANPAPATSGDQPSLPTCPERSKFFEDYRPLNCIEAWMDEAVEKYKDLNIVSLKTIGTSHEGRALKVLVIGKNPDAKKKQLFFHGTVHAREWLSPTAMLYIADHLLSNYESDKDVMKMVDNLVFHILPVSNPDGYAFTWPSLVPGGSCDRLWRKSRKPVASPCIGVDMNRNWDSKWCESANGGRPGAGQACSDTYCGPSAFSEKEVIAIRDYVMPTDADKKLNFRVYIDFHTFAQMFMTPFGYNKEPDEKVTALAMLAAAAIKAKGNSEYVVGTVFKRYGHATGSGADWLAEQGIEFSYGVEMRPVNPDGGTAGFLLHPSHIVPNGEEMVAAITTIAQHLLAP